MVLNISHDDKKKYQELRKSKKLRARKKRTTVLSESTMKNVLDRIKVQSPKMAEEDIQIDEHVKMNDNWMRTGPYRPKSK